MKKIKENPIKYVKMLVILYVVLDLTTRILASASLNLGLIFLSLIGTIISYIPVILFAAYVFLYYKTGKKQGLLPLAYAAAAVLQLISILRYGLINININDIVALIVFVFLAVDGFTGFKRLGISKKLVILNAVVVLVFTVMAVIRYMNLPGYYWEYISVLTGIMSCVQMFASVILMLAYVIFWKFCIDKKKTSLLENDLVYLRQQFDLGEITEQEYLKKKEEVLSKL